MMAFLQMRPNLAYNASDGVDVLKRDWEQV
jgi:hypothetical protein